MIEIARLDLEKLTSINISGSVQYDWDAAIVIDDGGEQGDSFGKSSNHKTRGTRAGNVVHKGEK